MTSVKRRDKENDSDKFFLYVILFHLFTAISDIFKD